MKSQPASFSCSNTHVVVLLEGKFKMSPPRSTRSTFISFARSTKRANSWAGVVDNLVSRFRLRTKAECILDERGGASFDSEMWLSVMCSKRTTLVS